MVKKKGRGGPAGKVGHIGSERKYVFKMGSA